jgi:8-oxo-dGTP pyrophosphatase MutT (NUDIX family)
MVAAQATAQTGNLHMPDFMRHITTCQNARLPGGRRAFFVGEEPVGWVQPRLAERLLQFGSLIRATSEGVALTEPQALGEIARVLSEEGWFRWRHEAFDVHGPDGAVVAQIDRGALPSFGMTAYGVHLNGLVQRTDGWHLWVGRRADDRPLDPGKLDHLAAGGVPAGLTPWQTLLKEAEEEAGLASHLTARAQAVGEITYAMERPEGLRRDRLFCFDLMLPEDFVPTPLDNEITGFSLWPLPDVMARVAETDDFKFNVNLVLIDLFLRHGLDDPGGRLRAGLQSVR